MKRLKVATLSVVSALFFSFSCTSCSDDDSDSLSRTIKCIDIWETGQNRSDLLAQLLFSYDKQGVLSQVSSNDADGNPFMDVSYAYPSDDEFRYIYTSDRSSGRIEGTLENGRAYSCKFSDKSVPTLYSYTDDGYLKESNSQEIVLEYTWKGGDLSSIRSSERAYNSEFETSSLSNDYSVDLNVLPHLLSGADYMEVMNTYCHLSGVLGKKSKHLLEEVIYDYEYAFDADGRLTEVTLKSSLASKSDYTFKLTYSEN